ncbi:MAG TPA: MBL fold metallo-hydrolase [Parvularculaceae bacterium]|nr:MBL fold metallo-hydrolase [Parvularculaceae bacterium]
MATKVAGALLSAALLGLSAPAYAKCETEGPNALKVAMYKGGFATVNSFIFSDGRSIIVLDAQRKPYEAEKLIELIKSVNLPVTHILISHGHTDHFTGMPWLMDAFPDAKVVVANEDIRKDIKDYAIYMDQGGATESEPILEPRLKPKSPENPDGFDYESSIRILKSNKLKMKGGCTLTLETDYAPNEGRHMTTVYSKELNALFLSDLGYNHIHPWMGDDIDRARVISWRNELVRVRDKYAPLNPIIYPGHGDATDMSMFDEMIGYFDNFLHVTETATSREEAMMKMKELYPDYGEADFFLLYSIINHVQE